METHSSLQASDKRLYAKCMAAGNGIDDRFIGNLVDKFYGHIRGDTRLGPLFDAVIKNRWALHLSKMKDFWGAIAFSDGRFSGNPILAHKRLDGVTTADFEAWLSLFRAALDQTAPTPQARAFFIERATRIAQRLQSAMFDVDKEQAA